MPKTESDSVKLSLRGPLERLAAVTIHVVLLVSAFPPGKSAESAWFAMVPIILLARFTRGLKRTFLWGWGAGTAFWLINLSWLLKLSATGGSLPAAVGALVGLSAYCGLYTGLFAMLASHLFDVWVVSRAKERGSTMGDIKAQLSLLASLPLIWAGLEYLRGTLFTGFPWNGLGVSQFRNEGLLQLASWGGVYGVSAIVMLANSGLAFTMLRFVDMFQRRKGPRFNLPLMLGLGGAMVLWLHGVQEGRRWSRDTAISEVRIVAVQPAVPQLEKWEPGQDLEIAEKLTKGTGLAAALNPAMIIWPETACPDLVNTSSGLATGFAAAIAGDRVPILAGAIEYELLEGKTNFYNSSILYGAGGTIEGVYRKMHLVPFGEYIPGETLIPSLARMAPLGFICTAGSEMTVFKCGSNEVPFSALICFEDVFPSLSRLAVRNGARFLVNQTNDAWFDGTSAPVQHLANAVFRCVENKVAMVRCANTGITCFISPLGELDAHSREILDDAPDSSQAEQCNRMGAVQVSADYRPTFYNRFGDWAFALPCAMGTALFFALAVLGGWRKNRSQRLGVNQ